VQCRVAHKNDSKINYDFTMINLFNVRREFLSKEKAKKDVRCPYCYFVNLPINYITDKKDRVQSRGDLHNVCSLL